MDEIAVVTGGAGFIGHHLVKFLSQSSKVVALDNFSRGEASRLKNFPKNVILKDCDITNYGRITEVLQEYNVTKVYHLAAINGTENFYKIPIQIMDVGIIGCMNMLKYMAENSVKIGIFASSAEVYQDCNQVPTPENVSLIIPNVENPRYSYGLSKIFTEYYSYHFGKKYNMDISVFRPHNVYGPNMGLKHVIPEFIMEFLKEKSQSACAKIHVKGNLKAVRAFCYVDDIVNGIKLIADKNKGVNVYNLGSSQTITMKELLQNISLLLERNFEIAEDKDTHLGGTLLRCPDIKKAKALGFKPTISLPFGLQRTVDWYVTNYANLTSGKALNY